MVPRGFWLAGGGGQMRQGAFQMASSLRERCQQQAALSRSSPAGDDKAQRDAVLSVWEDLHTI